MHPSGLVQLQGKGVAQKAIASTNETQQGLQIQTKCSKVNAAGFAQTRLLSLVCCSDSITSNCSIQHIMIDVEHLSDNTCLVLAETIGKNYTIHSSYISARSYASERAIAAIAEAVKSNIKVQDVERSSK